MTLPDYLAAVFRAHHPLDAGAMASLARAAAADPDVTAAALETQDRALARVRDRCVVSRMYAGWLARVVEMRA